MSNVFIYWDNSNIFHEAQRLAEERNNGPDARYRVRINFANMLRLAHADRPGGAGLCRRFGAARNAPAVEPSGKPGRGSPFIQSWQFWVWRTRDARPRLATADAGGRLGLQRHSGHCDTADRGWSRIPGRARDSTGHWNGCTTADGGWKSCRGHTPATRGCVDGHKRTVSLSPWTIFMNR